MSKKRSRARRTTDRSATTDVVTQLEVAIRNPHAAAIGAVIGGLVPWFGRTLAHGEIQGTWSSNRPLALVMVAVVLGCGAFSGLSVYKFGKAAFGDPRKALGFVLALEGVMLVSHGVTSAVALGVLVLINAVSNGSVIALARDAACRRREADARRATSRRKTTPAAQHSQENIPTPTTKAPVVMVVPATPTAPSNAVGLVRWTPAPRHLDVLDAEILS
jgi:hypothetical protein